MAQSAPPALPRSRPESQGLATPAIVSFVEALDKIDTQHSFLVIRHGQVVAEGWWKPETSEKPHVLNSVSKSFNATAVGLAVAGVRPALFAERDLERPAVASRVMDRRGHPQTGS